MKRFSLLLLALLLMVTIAGTALAEATATPTPTGTLATASTIEEAAKQFLNEEMTRQAGLTENGWEHFIYTQGADEIDMDLEKFDVEKGKPLTVNFLLASGQPDVKTLDPYEGKAEAWLTSMQAAMLEHDTKAKTTLTITKEGSSYTAEFAPKAEAALQKSVKTIAAKIPKAFENKTILAAVTDYLMPTPIAIPKKAPEALHEDQQDAYTAYVARNNLGTEAGNLVAASLYALKSYKLDASEGPDQFVITYTSPNFDEIITASAKTVSHDLAYDEKAKEYTEDELKELIALQVNKDVAAYRHSKEKGESDSYTFSILDLPKNISHEQFHGNTAAPLSELASSALVQVQISTWMLPDYPAVPNPENGLLQGEKKGTKIILNGSKSEYPRCMMVYDQSENLVASVFLNANSKTTIYLPQGDYICISGIGDVWYGEEQLFGEYGYYQTSNLEVPSKKYYLELRYGVEATGRWKPIESTALDYDSLLPGTETAGE